MDSKPARAASRGCARRAPPFGLILIGSLAAWCAPALAQSNAIVHDGIGDRLCPLNDIDGDTCADFAFDDGCGWLWVLSGKTGKPMAKVEGDRDSSRHSRAAALFADIDADGAWDLVDWHGDVRPKFQLLLRSGKDLHMLRELEIPHGFHVADGAAPTAAGDWNGDGVPDVAIGARDDSGACILVLSGKDSSRLRACRVQPSGDHAKDMHAIGSFVASAARVGRADRVLAAVASESQVVLFRSEDTDHPTLIQLTERYLCSDRAFAFVGDRDADGIPDLALTSGTTKVLRDGNLLSQRLVRVHSGGSGSLIAEIPAGPENTIDGVSGAVLADLDGDGASEFLLACTGFLVGHVTLYSGKSMSVLRHVEECDACCASECRFGSCCVALGDVDGDAVADFAIGSNGGIDGINPGCVSVFSGKSGRKLYSIWKRDLFR